MKSPAFLFYSSDFIVGTATMTHEQRGQYILLLCYQHQTGHLTMEDMLKICQTHVLDSVVLSKFEKCDDGKYHNVRLHEEISKRLKYCDSRRKNRIASKDMSNICETHVEHMEDINENEDLKKEKIKRSVPPTLLEVRAYCLERNNAVDPEQFVDFYTANNWKIGTNPMKDWRAAVRTWEKRSGTSALFRTSKPETALDRPSPRGHVPLPVLEDAGTPERMEALKRVAEDFKRLGKSTEAA